MDTGELLAQWINWRDKRERLRGGKYNQTIFGEETGIAKQYVSNVISGRRGVGDKTLSKICTAFDITPAEFYAGPPSARWEEAGTCTVEREFVMPHALEEMDDDEVRLLIMRAAQKLEGETLRRLLSYAEGLREGSRAAAKKNIDSA